MNSIKPRILAGVIVVALVLTSACKAVETVARPVTPRSNQSSTARLWRDVPPIDGASMVELDLPFMLKLALYSAANDTVKDTNVKLNSFDFVVFRTTGSPEDVQAFYTAKRMTDAGWNAEKQPGCTPTASLGGLLCTFAKSNGDRHTALFIVAGRDDSGEATQIYYVRFESTRSPAGDTTGTPARTPTTTPTQIPTRTPSPSATPRPAASPTPTPTPNG